MRMFFGSLFAVIGMDQAVKFLLLQTGYLPIYYNRGYAFSLSLPEPWNFLVLSVFYGVAWWWAFVALRLNHRTCWNRLGVGMLLGGASSNLIDRLIHGGQVVDFIAVPYFSIFNIADVCITLGVIVLVLAELRRSYGQSGQSKNIVGRG